MKESTDRESLVEQLRESRTALMESAAGIAEESASWRPENGWSVLDCIEHCANGERGMLKMIAEMATPVESVGDRSTNESALLKGAADRTRKQNAPENARPVGRYKTLEVAVARFDEARERTIAYVQQCEDDMRGRMLDHPVAGRISARECLLLMMQHPRRHAEQIREIRAAGGF